MFASVDGPSAGLTSPFYLEFLIVVVFVFFKYKNKNDDEQESITAYIFVAKFSASRIFKTRFYSSKAKKETLHHTGDDDDNYDDVTKLMR